MQNFLTALKALARQERALSYEFLRKLREVEAQSMYLRWGYPSLFAFCCEELGYSEPEAHVRIQAMRLMRDLPEAEPLLKSGELSMSVAARAQKAFRRTKAPLARRREVLAAVVGMSVREADRKLVEFFPLMSGPERASAVTGGTRIEFTASDRLMAKLNRLKELMAHKNYEGRFDLLFEELADRALAQLEPANDAPALSTCQVKNSRYIPESVKRSLPWKDGCNFRGETGRRCGSRYGLQMDHIIEFSQGGTNARENLQLLCGPHNRLKHASAIPVNTANTKPRSPPSRKESLLLPPAPPAPQKIDTPKEP